MISFSYFLAVPITPPLVLIFLRLCVTFIWLYLPGPISVSSGSVIVNISFMQFLIDWLNLYTTYCGLIISFLLLYCPGAGAV